MRKACGKSTALPVPRRIECVAVGSYFDPAGREEGVVIADNSGVLTSTRIPVPRDANPDPGVRLSAISCSGPARCTVVGSYFDAHTDQHGFIAQQNGSTWTATRAPAPADALPNDQMGFDALACPASGSCVASAVYAVSSADDLGAILTESGGKWTARALPVPPSRADAWRIRRVDLMHFEAKLRRRGRVR